MDVILHMFLVGGGGGGGGGALFCNGCDTSHVSHWGGGGGGGGGLQFFKDTELTFPAQNTFW